jgi:hypothetical protein
MRILGLLLMISILLPFAPVKTGAEEVEATVQSRLHRIMTA